MGASWRLLEELLGASCDPLTGLNSNICRVPSVFAKCFFIEQEHDFYHWEASGRPLGGSSRHLKASLNRPSSSWEPRSLLGGSESENADCSMALQRFGGPLLWGKRQARSGPDPWRGVGGRHKSSPLALHVEED